MALLPIFDAAQSTTRDKIVNILIVNPNLTTKRINNLMKKYYAVNVTYQAIHKLLRQMVDQGMIIFENKSYSINKQWIDKLLKFVQKYNNEPQFATLEPIKVSDTTDLFEFKNLHEMEVFYISERENFFRTVNNYPKEERYICVHAPHQYFSLMSAQVEYDYMDKLLKTGTTHYSLVRGNTIVDQWIQKFYHSKQEKPYRIKLGAQCSSINETCIYPNKMIELYYTEKFWRFYSELYESVEKFEDINITQIMDNLYLFKNEPVKCLIHTDKSVIKIARQETLSQFNIKTHTRKVFHTTGIEKDNVVDLWSMSLQFLYTKEYVNNLIDFLRKKKVKSILDSGCGTGFPAIELKKSKFDVVCADDSQEMLNKLQDNCMTKNVTIPFYKLDWRELTKIKAKFDAIICRGNSLIYVDSWERYFNLEGTFDSIKKALDEMYKVLKPGGLLYVDITSQDEYDAGPKLTEKFGEKIIDNKRCELTWEVTHDWAQRRRVVHSVRKIEGKLLEYNYYSFLLKHEELQQLMKDVGFKKVQNVKIPGENGYTIYLGYK